MEQPSPAVTGASRHEPLEHWRAAGHGRTRVASSAAASTGTGRRAEPSTAMPGSAARLRPATSGRCGRRARRSAHRDRTAAGTGVTVAPRGGGVESGRGRLRNHVSPRSLVESIFKTGVLRLGTRGAGFGGSRSSRRILRGCATAGSASAALNWSEGTLLIRKDLAIRSLNRPSLHAIIAMRVVCPGSEHTTRTQGATIVCATHPERPNCGPSMILTSRRSKPRPMILAVVLLST